MTRTFLQSCSGVPEMHQGVSHECDSMRSINAASSLPAADWSDDQDGHAECVVDTRPLDRATAAPFRGEAPIRTLSVSLVAVAAIAASLLIVRSREEHDTNPGIVPAGENVPARLKLDAIREAGL